MGTKTWLNLVLLGVVVVLAALAAFEPGVEAPPPPEPLTTLDRGAVDTLVVSREGQGDVRLERRGEHWRLTAPLDLPANAHKVAALLDLLAAPSQGRVAAAEGDLERFGLAPPRAAVDYGATTIAFGATEALDNRRYLRVGEAVHLVRDRFFHHVTATPAGFASLRLLGPAPEVASIHLGEGTMVAREAGRWAVTGGPGNLSADAPVRLAQAWRDARAMGVEALGDAPPEGRRVRVWLAGGKDPLTFRVYQGDGEYWFARPAKGVRYRLPESSAQALLELAPAEAPPGSAAGG